MDDEPAVGWNEDPDRPNQYRYWNGSEWTGHATVSEDGHQGMSVLFGGSFGGWNSAWYRRILRNTVVFHTMAWIDCSVPLTRGDLRRFMQPREQRTLDEIQALRKGL
jgi:hypothetical protein